MSTKHDYLSSNFAFKLFLLATLLQDSWFGCAHRDRFSIFCLAFSVRICSIKVDNTFNVRFSAFLTLLFFSTFIFISSHLAVLHVNLHFCQFTLLSFTNTLTLGFVRVGGYEYLTYSYMRAVPNTTFNNPDTHCGYPLDDSLHFFRAIDDPDYPWTGVIFGLTISSVWYWCSDQVYFSICFHLVLFWLWSQLRLICSLSETVSM